MVDPRRLFAELPPKEPLTSLAALVRDWQYRYIDGPFTIHRDLVIDHTRDAGSWEEACDRACRSRNAEGKMWNHQSRVPLYVLLSLRDRLVAKEDMVMEVIGRDIDDDPFHSFHAYIVGHLAPPGIGPVTAYDVATRLASWLEVEPRSVYLHAGPTEGWLAICEGRIRTAGNAASVTRAYVVKNLTLKRRRILHEDLPGSLKRLANRGGMDQVEDFLCAYRHVMSDGGVQQWQ